MIFLTSPKHCEHIGRKSCVQFTQNPTLAKAPWMLPKIRFDSPAVGCFRALRPRRKALPSPHRCRISRSRKRDFLIAVVTGTSTILAEYGPSMRRKLPRPDLVSLAASHRGDVYTHLACTTHDVKKEHVLDPGVELDHVPAAAWRFWNDFLKNDIFPWTSHPLLLKPKIWPGKKKKNNPQSISLQKKNH